MKKGRGLLYLLACVLTLAGCGKAERPDAAGDGSGQKSEAQEQETE